MQKRRLGTLEVFAVGLGCATMTPFYDQPDSDTAIDTLRRAREIGVDLLDSSDAYGQGRNEELIAQAIKGHRNDYIIASKFGGRGRQGPQRGARHLPGSLIESCSWPPSCGGPDCPLRASLVAAAILQGLNHASAGQSTR